MAWVRRQRSNGVRVTTPITRPTQALEDRWRKKASWLQSCWIMKRRTRNAAAGIASGKASQ